MTVLVTGGEGFIGSYVVEALVEEGLEVVSLDKVTGNRVKGAYYERGDLRDPGRIWEVVDDWEPESVIHLASLVGTGISMEQPRDFLMDNVIGTVNLLNVIPQTDVETLVLASTVSVYGEGMYQCDECEEEVYPTRARDDLEKGEWEPFCPECCAEGLKLMRTFEDAPLHPRSVYASTKLEQEHLCILLGEAAGLRVAVGRLWNVYGPRQQRDNPYTGVTAMLMGAIERGEMFTVYEDGEQLRDYVYAGDVADALVELLYHGSGVYNVASGYELSLVTALSIIAEAMGTTFEESCNVVGKYREGDIRHILPANSKIRQLGWWPSVRPENGLRDLALAGKNPGM